MMANKSTKTIGDQHQQKQRQQQQQNYHHRQASSKGDIELAENANYGYNPMSKGSRTQIAIAQPTAAGDAALLPGWTQLWDEASARPYYYNEALGTTQWEKP